MIDWLLLATGAALAASQPSALAPAPLVPHGKWVIDYADGSCLLSRTYGDGNTSLAVQPGAAGGYVQLFAMDSGAVSAPISGRGWWSVDDGPPVAANFMLATPGARAVRIATMFVAPDVDALAAIRTASVITVDAGHERWRFALHNPTGGIAALIACQDDLYKQWGIDPVASRAQRAPVKPVFGDRAIADWFGPGAYPSKALNAHVEGRVVVVADVDASGKVAGCRVVETSGSVDLDRETCGIVGNRARFVPARDADGRPVASWFIMPVRWVIPH